MELSPSWEAASYAATQDLPKYFMEPKGLLHYATNRKVAGSIPDEMNF
jgi:hypothetical protein